MYLTLRQLQYFVATADAGSMTRAAQSLNVVPTALSMQLKAIEEGFGVVLFSRHSRGVKLTDLGLEFLETARQVLQQVTSAERLLAAAHAEQPQRTVRLGLPPALARLLGLGLLNGMAEALPGHVLQVYEGWSYDLGRRLQAGEIDVIVGYMEPGLAGLTIQPVAEDSLVFVEAAQPDGQTGMIGMAEVLSSNLVFYGEKSVGWNALSRRAEELGLQVGKERQVASIDIWRYLICRGGCTSVTSIGAVIDEVERGEVRVRELGEGSIIRSIVVAIRSEDAAEPWALTMLDVATKLLQSQFDRTDRHLRESKATGRT